MLPSSHSIQQVQQLSDSTSQQCNIRYYGDQCGFSLSSGLFMFSLSSAMAERAPYIHPAVPGAVRTRRTTSGALENIGALMFTKKKEPATRSPVLLE